MGQGSMRWLRHIVFAAAYVTLALALALTLPLSVAGMDTHTGVLFGLVALVFGGLLHEFWARGEERESLLRRTRHLQREVERLTQAVTRLEDLLGMSGHPARSGEVGAVMSEARMLERLAGQLPAEPPPPAPAPPQRPGRAPAPPEPALAEPGLDAPAAPRLAEPATLPLFGEKAPPRPLTAVIPERSRDSEAVLNQIRQALRADRVDIFLQPVVSLPQRKHRYYEVFSRIRGEDGSHLTPDRYLAVAEEAGLIAAIDNMLLFRCVQLIRETEKRHQNVGFFCNISAATLNDAAFMREFVGFMGQHPNLVTKLVFELGQADLMEGGAFATGFLDGLRRLGFRFSMDQVDRLDIDWDEMARHEIRYVKLDAARLLDPDGRFATPDKVRELKRLLDRNAIDLIAEKIETDKQLLELLDLYIDFGQGFLFGEPRLAKRQGA